VTYFIGNVGNVRFRRSGQGSLSAVVKSADVTTALNRVGFETVADNLITGDRVDISTTDSRGLLFIAPSSWLDGVGTYQANFSAFVNVNAAGGLRFFPSFAAAVNNTRTSEYTLETFGGDSLPVTLKVNDVSANILGDVTTYTFNTDREGLDITTLSDKFKRMYSAGLISGSGSIDCLFNSATSGIKETPLLMLQLINRVDIGSEFSLLLSITNSGNDPSALDIYYEFSAMVTRSGLEVTATDIISCGIDFVTTGEIKLLVGRPSGYILKEDDDRIALNQNNLAFLLAEIED
jgi:hypothetical protein